MDWILNWAKIQIIEWHNLTNIEFFALVTNMKTVACIIASYEFVFSNNCVIKY